MQDGDRKKKRRGGFRYSSRKQLAKSRMLRRQLQSSGIDLTTTTRTLSYDGALLEEVVVETVPVEGEILGFAASQDNEPFISECEFEEELTSGERFQETDQDMSNDDQELYQNKQGDEDLDDCARSTPSKALDAVSHSIIAISSNV